MTNNEDEFMKQYMETCKEQIEKLAKDPELLSRTLKPFMQMSQQFVAGGLLDGAAPNAMIPDLGTMDINKMVIQIEEMINYIKGSHKELVSSHSLEDDVIKNLDESSKRLRSLIKKILERIESK